LILAQKLMERLNINFVLQGLVVFPGRSNHLVGVDILKKRPNVAGRTFCDAISLFDKNKPCQAGEGRELEPGFQQPGIVAISVNE
jgi:hypothetical protein